MDNINYSEARGLNKIDESTENEERVRLWFLKNGRGNQTECQKALGLSDKTVRKHLRAILKGQSA